MLISAVFLMSRSARIAYAALYSLGLTRSFLTGVDISFCFFDVLISAVLFLACTPPCVLVGLHKMLFYVEAFVHESTL